MNSIPIKPRRWFQFRLTTWFVLVAILAWAMLYWPWVVGYKEWLIVPAGAPPPSGYDGGLRVVDFNNPVIQYGYRRKSLEPALLYPALALAAFAGWKAAWGIGHSIVRRRAANSD